MSKKTDSDETKYAKKFWGSLFIGSPLVIAITMLWWPEVLVFEPWGEPFFNTRGGFTDWVGSVWFIFAWAIGVTFVLTLLPERRSALARLEWALLHGRRRMPTASEILAGGFLKSLWAGVLEELTFRWIFFLSAIPGVVFANWLWGTFFGVILFGFLILGVSGIFAKVFRSNAVILVGAGAAIVGMIIVIAHGGFFDPIKWVYLTILIPIANWVTFDQLEPFLYHPASWSVGAALLSTNAFFRNGHKYKGTLGFINSWFIGMVLFWVLFTYGLGPAILLHFLYDLAIYVTIALTRAFR